MDPPEIGVHAPPLQETVANEEELEELEELEDPSAPQRSNGPENGVNEKPPPKFEAFEAESSNQEDPIIPDALPGPSSSHFMIRGNILYTFFRFIKLGLFHYLLFI